MIRNLNCTCKIPPLFFFGHKTWQWYPITLAISNCLEIQVIDSTTIQGEEIIQGHWRSPMSVGTTVPVIISFKRRKSFWTHHGVISKWIEEIAFNWQILCIVFLVCEVRVIMASRDKQSSEVPPTPVKIVNQDKNIWKMQGWWILSHPHLHHLLGLCKVQFVWEVESRFS